jgi:putative FmdB family regulatory protein
MPIYEYECKDCHERSEVIQGFSEAPLTHCAKCGGTLRKLISSPAVHFKGSGFYKTDYASAASKADSKAKSKGDSKSDSKSDSGGDSKGETKSDSKGETKSDTKGETKSETKTETKSESKSDSKASE